MAEIKQTKILIVKWQSNELYYTRAKTCVVLVEKKLQYDFVVIQLCYRNLRK